MASIFTPTNFGDALGPYRIDLTDCMGDSVSVINANTNYLASYTAAVSSTASSQINTATITLSTVPYTRLNNGNQTGNAPIFGARAWVNFDATRDSTGAANSSNTNRFIRNSGNVSNVLKLGTGDYRIIFTVSMPTADYCVTGVGAFTSGLGSIGINTTEVSTTSSVRVRHGHFARSGATGFPSDTTFGNVAVFC